MINKLNSIIKKFCDYNFVENIPENKLRKKKNGIQINNILFYNLKFSQINITKQAAVSETNIKFEIDFTRQSYDSKSENMSIKFYEKIAEELIDIYNLEYCDKESDIRLVAVDGTTNNNNKQKVMLNMCYFDISNNIPINLTSCGTENRNKEVQEFIKELDNNPNKYKNVIFVCDRMYHSYKLFDYLVKHDYKFIIRIKGSGDNLNIKKELKKYTNKYDLIENLRLKLRVITINSNYERYAFIQKTKKIDATKYKIIEKNDCVLITNLLNKRKYSDKKILQFYRQRWDIETYFKFLKFNHKFQHMDQNKILKYTYKKSYLCIIILHYIMKIIQNYLLAEKNIKSKIFNKKNHVSKINNSHTMTGIYNYLLPFIIKCELTPEILQIFYKNYIKIFTNKTNRHFTRTSKVPHSKWYVKGYSIYSQKTQIIEAINNDTINTLNKNLKVKARKIIKIEII